MVDRGSAINSENGYLLAGNQDGKGRLRESCLLHKETLAARNTPGKQAPSSALARNSENVCSSCRSRCLRPWWLWLAASGHGREVPRTVWSRPLPVTGAFRKLVCQLLVGSNWF